MFALRGMAVSLSVFVIVYCGLSLAVGMTWRRVRERMRDLSAQSAADWLFALRMLPVVAAAGITATFIVPSFVLLEPRAVDEGLGIVPALLGIGGALLMGVGLLNAARAWRRSRSAIHAWSLGAQPVMSDAPVRVWRIAPAVPAMTAVGILRPSVLVSGAAEGMLAPAELQSAMNHEVAHVRRRDNLKKLLLQMVAFPGMRGLDAAWLESAEMAADAAAVSSAEEALTLASALIKLSRLGISQTVDLTAGLVQSPAAVINARIKRLMAWSDARESSRLYTPWYTAAFVATFAFALVYGQLLAGVHVATEWLVR